MIMTSHDKKRSNMLNHCGGSVSKRRRNHGGYAGDLSFFGGEDRPQFEYIYGFTRPFHDFYWLVKNQISS